MQPGVGGEEKDSTRKLAKASLGVARPNFLNECLSKFCKPHFSKFQDFCLNFKAALKFKQKSIALLEMSNIPEEVTTFVATIPTENLFSYFPMALELATHLHPNQNAIIRYIISGSSLPDDLTPDRIRYSHMARAVFLRLPSEIQDFMKSRLPPSTPATGGKRRRASRKARKARHATRRH